MKTQAELEENLRGVRGKSKEHESNYEKFGWIKGENEMADNTGRYLQTWINAIEYALRDE